MNKEGIVKIAVPPQTPQFGLDQGESRADEVQSEFFFQIGDN